MYLTYQITDYIILICSLCHPDSCLSSCPCIQCYSSPLVLATNSKVCFMSFEYPSSFSVLILPGPTSLRSFFSLFVVLPALQQVVLHCFLSISTFAVW